jgi:calcium-dependent protein kinase
MRAMNHVNIIKLHEVYETDNSLYMVMELLKGGNLVDYLKQHGKFSEPKAAAFLRAILKGVNHAHECGIMHRDLKPENILFRQNEMTEENICIADFGLSTFINVNAYLFSRCGTPGFVAPEVVNLKDTKQKYNEICDEFSCGVIMHIL